MFIPPRKKRGPAPACGRAPRFTSVVTVGVVAVGAALGLVPSASADPVPSSNVAFVVDIVGDSYAAGDGISDAYLDPTDQRHRARVAPAMQALTRIAKENPNLRVDANIVASSGAVTQDFFGAQKVPDGNGGELIVNPPQRDQVRPTAQVVIVGFGGGDAELSQVLAVAMPSNTTKPGDLYAKVAGLGDLLDSSASDEAYLEQAKTSAVGQAPTLVARILQVLSGIAQRAPDARIMVTNYPVAIDARNANSVALIGERDLTAVQKFTHDLNGAIARAVRICQCANLVDLSKSVVGHEAYTSGSAFDERTTGEPRHKYVRPNRTGAALMANPIATDLARLLKIRAPAASDGAVTDPGNVMTRSGTPDRDGDLVPDATDAAPDDRTRTRHEEQRAGTANADHSGGDRRQDRGGSLAGGRPKAIAKPKSGEPRILDLVPARLLPGGSRPAPPSRADDRSTPENRGASNGRPVPATQPSIQDSSASAPTRPASPADARAWSTWALTEREKPRPGGDVPVEFLPPPAPAPKREADTELAQRDKEAAGADAAERKPDPATAEALDSTQALGYESTDSTRVSTVDHTAADDAESTDAQQVEEATPDAESAPAGETADVEPAEEDPKPDWAPAGDSDADRIEEKATPEPVPARDATPADTVQTGEGHAPAPEPDSGPAGGFEPAEPELSPATTVPDGNQASDDGKVCILIYPAPAGCGGSEEEGNAS